MGLFDVFSRGGKYFGKSIEPRCEYCESGKRAKDGNKVLCSRKGLVNAGDHCPKFVYSPLKRIPVKQMKMVGFLEGDYDEKNYEDEETAEADKGKGQSAKKTEPAKKDDPVKKAEPAPQKEETAAPAEAAPVPAPTPAPAPAPADDLAALAAAADAVSAPADDLAALAAAADGTESGGENASALSSM